MRPLFLAGLLAPALLLGAVAPANAQRSGVYEVTGTNLDGSNYRGLMEMQQVGTSTFHILWNIGGQLIEGVGMVSGLTFITAFSASDRTGLGVYEIKPGDVMEGNWSIVGAQTNGTETARWSAQQPPAGAAETPPAATPPGATPPATTPPATTAPATTPPATTPPAAGPATPTLPPPRN